MIFRAEMISHIGGRERNEDCAGYRLSDGALCAVVADGLGGHSRGDVAAHIAVGCVLDAFEEDPGGGGAPLIKGITRANEELVRIAADEDISLRTTTTAAVCMGNTLICAHVGDTRLYLIRGGSIRQLTTDHSVARLALGGDTLSGKDVRGHEDRSRLTRSLGAESFKLDAPIGETLMRGDRLLLCSDGLWDMLLEGDMLNCMNATVTIEQWLENMERLVLLRGKGYYDNFSALAVACD